MGFTFDKVGKNSLGYYYPTTVCIPNSDGTIGKCYASKDEAPGEIKHVYDGSFYALPGSSINHPAWKKLLPHSTDNSVYYVPVKMVGDKIATSDELLKFCYIVSLTENETKTLYGDILPLNLLTSSVVTVPSTFCANLDPCPPGVNCCGMLSSISGGGNKTIIIVAIVVCVCIMLMICAGGLFMMSRGSRGRSIPRNFARGMRR